MSQGQMEVAESERIAANGGSAASQAGYRMFSRIADWITSDRMQLINITDRINEIVLEKRAITADTALRLARYFGTTAEMWAGLQADYDLRLARYEKLRQIERDVEPLGTLLPAT